MQVIKPTDGYITYPKDQKNVSVFLAGTIEMGNSHDWQSDVCEIMKDYDVTFYNPRRVLPPTCKADIEYQIRWELEHLKKADIIFMYLAPNTISPISLLELGLYLKSDKPMIIVADPEYLRFQNVETTFDYFYPYKSKTKSFYVIMDSGIEKLKSLIWR